jgi:short-subunit dehydrogenase
MKRILITGANSAIAQACARLWALEKASFALIARDPEKLKQVADDLIARGASKVHSCLLDLNAIDKHAQVLEECLSALGGIDIALIAHGTLPDQLACQRDAQLALREFSSNALSAIAWLTLLASRIEEQRMGTIAIISSVAGDRGRASNYVYGAAKSAVSVFCEGLRGRLFRLGIHVLTIKPGFVDSPMTRGLALPGVLVAPPARAAADILKAIQRKSDTLYTPGFWALIMIVIRLLPSFVFKRLNL